MMAKLTEVLMWLEKVPDTPTARKFMKGWIYEVAEDADYNAGSPDHHSPFYFLEIRIPINRLDLLAKQGQIRDFTRVVMDAEGSDNRPENARRVWVTINEHAGSHRFAVQIHRGVRKGRKPARSDLRTHTRIGERVECGGERTNASLCKRGHRPLACPKVEATGARTY
jgi:hypothetical protein